MRFMVTEANVKRPLEVDYQFISLAPMSKILWLSLSRSEDELDEGVGGIGYLGAVLGLFFVAALVRGPGILPLIFAGLLIMFLLCIIVSSMTHLFRLIFHRS